MKKEIKVLVMMALAIASLVLATSATKNPEIIRISKGDAVKTIDIRLANLQHRGTSVVVQDMEGKCWYSESIWNEDGYTKRLNLNGMPTGHYLCFVKNRGEFFTRSFCLDETVEAHLDDAQFDVVKFCREMALSHSQAHRKLSALTGFRQPILSATYA